MMLEDGNKPMIDAIAEEYNCFISDLRKVLIQDKACEQHLLSYKEHSLKEWQEMIDYLFNSDYQASNVEDAAHYILKKFKKDGIRNEEK